MKCCTFGAPSKKILYFIGIFIFIFLKELLEYKEIDCLFKDKRAQYFESIIFYTIGDLLSGFFALIVKKRTNIKIEKNLKNHKKINSGKIDLSKKTPLIYKRTESSPGYIPFKRVLYLSIYDFLSQSCSLIYAFIFYEEKYKLPYHKKNLSLVFDIISRFFLNKIILKAQFYSHHYLSITINVISFVILSISDLYFIIPECNIHQIFYICKTILKIILYSFENVEGKIGLNSEFLNPFNLLFYKGIIHSVILIIMSLFFIIFQKYEMFTALFDNKEFIIKIILIIFSYIILNMFANICIWKIIDIYSIQHLTIAKGGSFFLSYIYALINNDLEYQVKNIYYFYFTDIIGYILLFIGTLIHNEIIILKCFNLNKYTYRELKSREEEDFKSRNDTINTLISIEEQTHKSGKTFFSNISHKSGKTLISNITYKSEKTINSNETKKTENNQNYKDDSSILEDSIEF